MSSDAANASELQPGQVKFACPCGKRILTPGPGLKILCPKCGKALRSPGEPKGSPRPVPRKPRRKFDIMGIVVGVLGVVAVAAVAVALGLRLKDDVGRRKQEQEHQRSQELVSVFAHELLSTPQPSASAVEAYHESLAMLAAEQAQASEVREAADAAAGKCREARTAVRQIDMPEGLPQQVVALLSDARRSTLESYESQEKALALAVGCMNHPTPGNLHEVERLAGASQDMFATAACKLGEAKKQMGIAE